jgi:hypothetical protein
MSFSTAATFPTSPHSPTSINSSCELAELNEGGVRDYRVASGGGRMVTTMDRYGANWGIVEAGWKAHVLGSARAFESAAAAITAYRHETPGISDQVLPAFTVVEDDKPVGRITSGDAVVVFNFRGDRAIEISEALCAGDEFEYFDRAHPAADLICLDDLLRPRAGLPRALPRSRRARRGHRQRAPSGIRRRRSSPAPRRRSSDTSPTSGTATAPRSSTLHRRPTSRSPPTRCLFRRLRR